MRRGAGVPPAGDAWVGVDASPEMLGRAPAPHRGLVAVAAPSRHDSPELAHALPQVRATFDASARVAGRFFFSEVEVEPWNAPLLELPTKVAVRDYLIGQGVERRVAASAAETVAVPRSVTKGGALALGRKRFSRGRPASKGTGVRVARGREAREVVVIEERGGGRTVGAQSSPERRRTPVSRYPPSASATAETMRSTAS